MIIKNSMLVRLAGGWIAVLSTRIMTSYGPAGGTSVNTGGAKTGAVVITPAIFSLLTSHSDEDDEGRQRCTL